MDKIGYKIKLNPGEKISTIELSEENLKQLGIDKNEKTAMDYLKEFIGNEELYYDFDRQFNELKTKSLPENLECAFCTNESTLEEDKACTKYYLQMNVTLFVATAEFVQIVLNNRHIFKDDANTYQRLAKHFIRSLRFVKGEGFLWLDLAELIKLILSEGFITLSKEFGSSDKLRSLQIINNTLDDLNSRELYNELHNKPDKDFIPIQKKFFMNKQAYLKENLQLEELQARDSRPHHKHTIQSRPDRTDIAFYAYYLSKSGSIKNLTKLTFPSVKAWKQIGEKFNRSYKNIQMKYNEILNTGYRISPAHINAIEYVIDKMLNDFPETIDLAKDELKLAKLK